MQEVIDPEIHREVKEMLGKLEKPIKELTWLVECYNQTQTGEIQIETNKSIKYKEKIRNWMKCHRDLLNNGCIPDEIVRDLCSLKYARSIVCKCGVELRTQEDIDSGVCGICRSFIELDERDWQKIREEGYEDHSYYPEEKDEE